MSIALPTEEVEVLEVRDGQISPTGIRAPIDKIGWRTQPPMFVAQVRETPRGREIRFERVFHTIADEVENLRGAVAREEITWVNVMELNGNQPSRVQELVDCALANA